MYNIGQIGMGNDLITSHFKKNTMCYQSYIYISQFLYNLKYCLYICFLYEKKEQMEKSKVKCKTHYSSTMLLEREEDSSIDIF